MGNTKQPHSYAPWQPEDDRRLMELQTKGTTYEEIAEQFGRTVGSIKSRLRHLAMITAQDQSKKR